jgi:Holliday junction resolvase RusA-like endonuclease
MVQAPLRKLNKLIENQKMYISRSKLGSSTKKINNLEQQLDEWIQYTEQLEQQIDDLVPPERHWTTLPCHPFSENYQYDKSYHITPAYRYWRNNFPRHLVPSREEYEANHNIDFSQPICVEFKLIHMSKFDTANLIKSLLDMLFNDILGVDDNIVTKIVPETIAYCESYDEGEISFCIYNI